MNGLVDPHPIISVQNYRYAFISWFSVGIETYRPRCGNSKVYMQTQLHIDADIEVQTQCKIPEKGLQIVSYTFVLKAYIEFCILLRKS